MIKGASASQEETIVRALQESEKIKIFIYENFGDFKTYKLMVRIANCESNFNQQAVNRKTMDWGLFQISEKYWDKTAQSMGLNYKEDWKSNVLMARYIYQTQGISAWNWSKFCWSK
jgi:hypothetical protein